MNISYCSRSHSGPRAKIEEINSIDLHVSNRDWNEKM